MFTYWILCVKFVDPESLKTSNKQQEPQFKRTFDGYSDNNKIFGNKILHFCCYQFCNHYCNWMTSSKCEKV
jgi:hypothetical protein